MGIPTQKRKLFIGYLAAVFLLLGFSSSAAAAQALQTRIPDLQLCFLRYIAQFFLALIAVCIRKEDFKWPIDQLPTMIGISVTSIVYTVFFFHGVAILPLTDAYAFFSLVASVMLGLTTKFYQDKDLGFFHNISILIGALGCLAIIQPWRSFDAGFIPNFIKQEVMDQAIERHGSMSLNSTDFDNAMKNVNVGWITFLGYFFIAIAGINEAVSLTLVEQLKNASPETFALSGSAMCGIPSLVLSFYMEEPVWITDPEVIGFAALHSIGAGIGVIATLVACMNIAPSRLTIVQSFSIIILLIFQYTLMTSGLFGRTNVLEVLGCITIVVSLLVSVASSCSQKHHEDAEG